VRTVLEASPVLLSTLRSPFVVEGAPNVFIETIKRGDDNFESKSRATTTIIVRLYEAFGGHAQARIRLSRYMPVIKAYTTNLLEDDESANELCTTHVDNAQKVLSLDFRAFEVKTVKLVLREAGMFPLGSQCSLL
jgi:alpha-mannosidase